MGLKDFFNKLKAENRNFIKTTQRINGSGFYGNVNRGVKNGDFWEGSYVSIEGGCGVIYGSNQDDYTFTKENIASFELGSASAGLTISVGNTNLPAIRYIMSFTDGKKAQMDIATNKLDSFKMNFDI